MVDRIDTMGFTNQLITGGHHIVCNIDIDIDKYINRHIYIYMYGVFYKWGIPNSWMVHDFMENPSING